MLDEEDIAPKRSGSQPRPLAGLSVEELEAYIGRLRQEITRVEGEVAKRKDVRGAAEAMFRRPDPSS